jgi:autotransporter-associated beta strand protein
MHISKSNRRQAARGARKGIRRHHTLSTAIETLEVRRLLTALTWSPQVGSNAWDVGVSANWKDPSNNQVVFQNGDSVTFDDSAGGGAVAISGTVSPGGMDVSSGANYDLGGTGSIAGTTSLTKAGAGSLTLSGTDANTFTGSLFLNEGTLVLDKTDGVNALAGGIGAFNAIEVNGPGTLVQWQSSEQVADARAIRILDGTANLNGFTETISGMAMQVNTTPTLNTGTGTLNLTGGFAADRGTVNINPGGTINTSTASIGGGSGGGEQFNVAGTLNLGGGGTTTVFGLGTFSVLPGGNVQTTTSLLDLQGTNANMQANSTMTIGGGGLRLATITMQSDNVSPATIFLNGDVTNNGDGIFNNAGAGTQRARIDIGAATRMFTANSNAIIVNAEVVGTGGVVKAGNAFMRLGAPNTYTGLTTVNGGYLQGSTPTSFGTTASGTIINNGAQIDVFGTTTAESFNYTSGGVLRNESANSPIGGIAANNLPSTVTGSINITGTLLVVGNRPITVNTVTGTGGITLDAGQNLVLGGTAPNTNAGRTTVISGTLDLNKPAGVTALAANNVPAGDVVIAGGQIRWLNDNQVQDNSGIEISGGNLNLNNRVETARTVLMELSNASQVNTGTGTLTLSSVANLQRGTANIAVGGTLSADSAIFDGSPAGTSSINVNGLFSLGAGGISEFGNAIVNVGATGRLNTVGQFVVRGHNNTVQPGGQLNIGAGGLKFEDAGNTINLVSGAGTSGELNLSGDVTSTAVFGSTIANSGAGATPGTVNLIGNRNIGTTNGGIIISARLNQTAGDTLTIGSTAATTVQFGRTQSLAGSLSVLGTLDIVANNLTVSQTLSGNGTIQGTGTTFAANVAAPGATGGSNVGTLKTTSLVLNPGATYQAQLSGATGDQLDVTGTVTLTGSNLSLSGAPTAASYILINNDGSDAVAGTFNGLADGAIVSVGGRFFSVTYSGGTGNDVAIIDALTVTNTNNSGAGSLRQVITNANTIPGADTIRFAIASGAQTIAPTSTLPNITGPTIVDGTTQPGYAGTPLIELSGASAGAGVSGLVVNGAASSNSVIRGLVVNRFSAEGIIIRQSANAIVQGNYVGTDLSGTVAAGNNIGIFIQNSTGATVGGTTPGSGNLVSGNRNNGISVQGAAATPATGNTIQGNFTGTGVGGIGSIPNALFGINLSNQANNNLVGGLTAAARNISCYNGAGGIQVGSVAVGTGNGNVVQGNWVGIDAAGNAAGNLSRGINIAGSNNTIGGTAAGAANVIANNGTPASNGFGVVVNSGIGNSIRRNSVHDNRTLGIDLLPPVGVNPNDPTDPDVGGNNLQNHPVITSAAPSAGSTTIQGTLNSTPNSTFVIEFFSNAAADPSGFGEGQTFLGDVTVSTDALGDASFTFVATPALATGTPITATATNLATGDTSEFSAAFTNTPPLANDDAFAVAEDGSLAGNVLANDTDADNNSLTAVLVSGPSNAASFTLNPDGSFSYVPAADYNGPDSFTYKASDGTADSNVATVNISVTEVNDAPTAGNDTLSDIAEDSGTRTIPFATLLANDSAGPANESGQSLTIVSVGGAVGGAVAISGTDVLFTPAPDYNGPASFTYTVQDNGTTNGTADPKTASATASFMITAVNDVPTAGHDTASVDEDDEVTVSVLANDSAGPSNEDQTLTIIAHTDGANGTVIDNNDGTLTYVPDPDYFGGDSFTYTVQDSDGATATATVNITVDSVNDGPVQTNGRGDAAEATTDEDTAVVVNLLENLSAGPANEPQTLTLVSFTQPAHGVVTDNGDGTVTYTPDPNYNGDDGFSYTVQDSEGATATFTAGINVNPVNDNPTVAADNGAVVVDEGATAANSGTFADIDLDTVTLTASEGTITWAGTSSDTWTWSKATTDNEATHTVTITADDGHGGIATTTFTLTVNNLAPTANADSASTPLATPVSGNVLTNDTDPAGANDPLIVTGFSQPANGTVVVAADGNFTYRPDSTFSGTDTFTYAISDGDGGSATATVTITVGSAAPGSITLIPDTCMGGNALLIVGTSGADNIHVTPGSGNTIQIQFNGVTSVVPKPTGRIIIMAGGGDDRIQVAGSISNSVWAYGEDGNDTLDVGNVATHGNLLIGGNGNDDLKGGGGRDVMIAGQGGDKLIGNADDDILVAGYTTKDSPSSAGHGEFWCDILDEWTSSNTIQNRVHHLKGDGLGTGTPFNGTSFLNSTTLVDDNSLDQIDMLNGSSGNDWYLYEKGEDKVVGESSLEESIDVENLP